MAGGRSRLHLIDLGSASKSRDPNNVSLSLSALGNVIMALLNGQRHVPHRLVPFVGLSLCLALVSVLVRLFVSHVGQCVCLCVCFSRSCQCACTSLFPTWVSVFVSASLCLASVVQNVLVRLFVSRLGQCQCLSVSASLCLALVSVRVSVCLCFPRRSVCLFVCQCVSLFPACQCACLPLRLFPHRSICVLVRLLVRYRALPLL